MNAELKTKIISFFKRYEEDFIHAFKRDLADVTGTPFEIVLFDINFESFANLKFQITDLKFLNEGLSIATQPIANIPYFGTPEYNENLKKYYAFESKCETDFWRIEKNNADFEEMANFNAYQDVVVDKVQAKQYRPMQHLFNTKGWLEYAKNLLIFFYRDFEPIAIKKKILLRHKAATEANFNLYLECDSQLFKKNLDKGKIELPSVQILLVTKQFAADFEKNKPDIFSDVAILGKLSHPFIQEPCSPIGTFFAHNTLLQLGPGNFETINNMKYDHLEKGNIHIYNSNDFGILLQKHLYFYFATCRFYAKSYIDFLAKLED